MKKFILSLCMVLTMVGVNVMTAMANETTADIWDGSTSTPFDYALGTKDDPYLIKSCANWKFFVDKVNTPEGNYPTAHYRLMVDLNFNNKVIDPVGKRNGINNYVSFSGVFDGNNKKIYNLYVERGGDGAGLFGQVGSNTSPVIIANLGIESGIIYQRDLAWRVGLVGNIEGHQAPVYILNCYNKATIYNYGNATGGIVGHIEPVTGIPVVIANTFAMGQVFVNGNNSAAGGAEGGLVGVAKNSTILSSYTAGNVKSDCFLFDKIDNRPSPTTNINEPMNSFYGKLVGKGAGGVSNSYYESGEYDNDDPDDIATEGAPGKSTAYMKLQAFVNDLNTGQGKAWLLDVNNENDGYPVLNEVTAWVTFDVELGNLQIIPVNSDPRLMFMYKDDPFKFKFEPAIQGTVNLSGSAISTDALTPDIDGVYTIPANTLDPVITVDRLYSITTATTGNGSIELLGESTGVTGPFESGEKVTVTVTPDQGYMIYSITVNDVAHTFSDRTEEIFDITVDTDYAVKVVFVDENMNMWDGLAGIGPLEGEGTAAEPYLIKSGADWAYAVSLVNTNAESGKYNTAHFLLVNDIDFNNHQIEPFGLGNRVNANYAFRGFFDGNNKKLYNLNILQNLAGETAEGTGLFGRVTGNVVIANLGIESGTIQNNHWRLGFVGDAASCTSLLVINCYNKASVGTTVGCEVGGMLGNVNEKVQLINCFAGQGTLTKAWAGNNNIGGLVGIGLNNNGAKTTLISSYSYNNIRNLTYDTNRIDAANCGFDDGTNTAYMKSTDFVDYLNTNQGKVWLYDATGEVNNGYPYLNKVSAWLTVDTTSPYLGESQIVAVNSDPRLMFMYQDDDFKFKTVPAISTGVIRLNGKVLKPDSEGIYTIPANTVDPVITIGRPALTAVWQGTTVDWTATSNWKDGITPIDIDTVRITSDTDKYPVLADKAEIHSIIFEPGAELGNQHLLEFTKEDGATATVNFNIFAENARWTMLSLPFTETRKVSGLPSKNGPGDTKTPYTWVMEFLPDGNNEATWDFLEASNDDDLPGIGQGFAVSIGDGVTGNIVHEWNNGTAFPVSLAGTLYNASATFPAPLDFGKDATDDASSFALVGNPFMTSIDFSSLQANNPTLIKDNYLVWTLVGTDEGFAGYAGGDTYGVEPTHSAPLDEYIAPLQAFFVEAKTGITSGDLRFDLADDTDILSIAAIRLGTLRSATTNDYGKLDIIAANGTVPVKTFITNKGGMESARKLKNGCGNIPDIYTLSQDKTDAFGAQVINANDISIPLAIATGKAGDMSLTFSGMSSYANTYIYLVDNYNTEQPITALTGDSYQYDFEYAPLMEGENATADQNRFYIVFSPTAITGIGDITTGTLSVYAKDRAIHAVSSAADPIREIAVYNVQGNMLYKAAGLNTPVYTISMPENKTNVYIVRVITDKGMENVKVINK